MKKIILLCVVVAIAILTSCEKKKEYAPVIGNIYTEKVDADSVRLVSFDGKSYSPIFNMKFVKAEYDNNSKLILAYVDDRLYVFNTEGSRRGSSEFASISYASGGLVYLKGNHTLSLYIPGKDIIFGPYRKIFVVEDKVFAMGPQGWGLLDTDYHYLQDMVYDNLYIVNQKSAKEYDVLRCRNGNWDMVSSKDVVYDERSVKAAVKLLMSKKYKPADPAGVIEMKF